MVNTYILDVDGTVLRHIPDFENIHKYESLEALPGAREKTAEWHCRGDKIIFTTARPESLRELTVKQLHNAGIFYDLLVMGVGAGNRILVNDYVENTPYKAWAYNVLRNKEGIKHIP